ncbi:MAG: DUF362 domain-containing protein, partial [Treponema sp.]|nr:DUF362 domain-containing protein [Treponema sp.]
IEMKKFLVFALLGAVLIGAFAFMACASDPAGQAQPSAGFPTVFFTSDISAQGLLDVFNAAMAYAGSPVTRSALSGMNVGINIHGGEAPSAQGQRAFSLDPALIGGLVNAVDGTIVETNVSYMLPGVPAGMGRQGTASHIAIIEEFFNIGSDPGQNNWPIAILDDPRVAGGPIHTQIPVNVGRRLDRNYVGIRILDFDFYINLNHFTGHRQAGFGAALKNMSLGMASGGTDVATARGKVLVHSGGRTPFGPFNVLFPGGPAHPTALFQEAIAESALSIRDYLESNDVRMLHITVLNNMSIDCDCVPVFQQRTTPDINCLGIVASWDPVAVDQAAIDLIWRANGTQMRADVVAPAGDARWNIADVIAPAGVPAEADTVGGAARFTGTDITGFNAAVARGARADGQGINLLQRIEGLNGEWKLGWGQAIGLGSIVYRFVDINL